MYCVPGPTLLCGLHVTDDEAESERLLTQDHTAEQWKSQETDSPRTPKSVSLTITGSAVWDEKGLGVLFV